MQSKAVPSYHTLEADQKPTRDTEYLKYRELVYVELLKAGMDKDAEDYIRCSDPALSFWADQSGELPDGVIGVNACSADSTHPAKAVCPTCHKRYCCDCAHQQSARLLARYTPFIKGLVRDSDEVYKLRHIVLTTPISLYHDDCREQMLELFNKIAYELWDILLGKGWRKDSGVLIASDFGENGHKLHFHILAYCPYIDKEKITEAWLKVTGGLCEVNWIRLVKEDHEQEHTVDGAIAEILKYATKLWKRDKTGKVVYLDPALVPVLARVLKGTRRVRSYGIFNGFVAVETPHVCGACAAPIIHLNRLDWEIYAKTGFLPEQFELARSGVELESRIGNNFFEGGGGEIPITVHVQPVLPTFDAVMDGKHHRQFEMGV